MLYVIHGLPKRELYKNIYIPPGVDGTSIANQSKVICCLTCWLVGASPTPSSFLLGTFVNYLVTRVTSNFMRTTLSCQDQGPPSFQCYRRGLVLTSPMPKEQGSKYHFSLNCWSLLRFLWFTSSPDLRLLTSSSSEPSAAAAAASSLESLRLRRRLSDILLKTQK